MTERILSHYGVFAFTDWFWQGDRPARRLDLQELKAGLGDLAERVYLYTLFPTRVEADLLIWSSWHIDDPAQAHDLFQHYARQMGAWRTILRPVNSLWGFTRPSQYATGKSAQELDPFRKKRRPYLVVYPFSKTSEWYLMSRDTRQGMMNAHIRVGRQYPEITQLLLYSTGLQDQEFVVVYETSDPAHFSELVSSLRETEGRRYTLRDTPIYTALHLQPKRLVSLFS